MNESVKIKALLLTAAIVTPIVGFVGYVVVAFSL